MPRSLFKCDVCDKHIAGRLETAYPTVIRAGIRFFRKRRLCNDHMTAMLRTERPHLIPIDEESEDPGASECGYCGQLFNDYSPLEPLFVTVYRHGADRVDYFSYLCPGCADSVISHWRLSAA